MKLAVIDTGTKATRLLIGDVDEFRAEGFAFELFRNEGNTTNMGQFLASRAVGDFPALLPVEATHPVIETIRRFQTLAVAMGVRRCIAVGTAVWRLAANVEELRERVFAATGLHIQVLTREQEAAYSFLAAEISCRPFYRPGDAILHIDQGGGSTEVIAGEARPTGLLRHGLYSVDLGTVRLRNWFLAHPDLPLRDGLAEVRIESELEVQRFSWPALLQPVEGRHRRCFAVGSALMHATGKSNNRQQHGIALPVELLEDLSRQTIQRYQEAGAITVRDLLTGVRDSDEMDAFIQDLDVMVGLPVYASIARKLDVRHLTVCGTGLRYGIFFAFALGRETPLLLQRWPK